MKSIFTLLAVLFSGISAFAFNSRLSISSTSYNDRILVVVDGKNYQSNNRTGADIMIDDLRAGYHSIKVYRQSSNPGRGRNNSNNNYNNLKILYNGNVYVRNGYHTDIIINRFGKAFVDERQIVRNINNDDNDYNDNDNDWNWNRQPMNERSFEQLKQSIRRESFEENKMNVLKTAVRDNRVSTAQATELVKLFSFDNNKLNIAKYLYHYATDYNNYYLVANSFSFGSSKQELLRYIEQNRRSN